MQPITWIQPLHSSILCKGCIPEDIIQDKLSHRNKCKLRGMTILGFVSFQTLHIKSDFTNPFFTSLFQVHIKCNYNVISIPVKSTQRKLLNFLWVTLWHRQHLDYSASQARWNEEWMFKEVAMACDTTPIFSCRDCGKPLTTSTKAARALDDIRSVSLPNTSLERNRYINLLSNSESCTLISIHFTWFTLNTNEYK
jgi:hypothetical protein